MTTGTGKTINGQATYNDGKSSARHQIGISLTPWTLVLLQKNGEIIGEWRYEDLRLAEEVTRGRPVRLKLFGSDARLTITNWDLAEDIFRRAKHLGEKAGTKKTTLLVLFLVLAALFIAVTLWAIGMFAMPRFIRNWFPTSWEEDIGAKLADNIEKDFPVCSGEDGSQALQSLTDRLVQAAGDDLPPLKVKVLNAPRINAYALPGGEIRLFQGLIAEAASPDELAGVLAHEITHVKERHGMQSLARQFGFSTLLSIFSSNDNELATLFAGTGGALAMLSYSRGEESAADEGALDILRAAEVNPERLGKLLERLHLKGVDENDSRKQSGDSLSIWLSSHPAPAERSDFFLQSAFTGRPALSPAQWQSLKVICATAGQPQTFVPGKGNNPPPAEPEPALPEATDDADIQSGPEESKPD